MSKTKSTRNWRAALTPAEQKQLIQLEKHIGIAIDRLALLRLRRLRIQNRASVRAGK